MRSKAKNVELVDRERMASLTGTGFYRGRMLDRRSGTVQPLSYARGLATAAAASGTRIFGSVRVSGFEHAAGRWVLRTLHARVAARQVLSATNGHTGDLHPALKTAMVVVQSYQIATDPLPQHLDGAVLPTRLPVSDLMQLGIYFRRDDDGRFIIGGRGSRTERYAGHRRVVRRLTVGPETPV